MSALFSDRVAADGDVMEGLSGVSVACVVLGVLAGGLLGLVPWLVARRRGRRRAAAMRAALARLTAAAAGGDVDLSSVDLAPVNRSVAEALQTAATALHSALARMENERDVVLSKVEDGIIVVDARGVVRRVNSVQLERLGLPQEQVVGRSIIEVMHDHEVHEAARRCLSSGAEQTAVVETATGRRTLEVSAASLEQNGGCVVVLRDRTEMRRLEKVRRDFVANVSHELRTPLATLKLLSETLSLDEGEDPEVLRDYLGRIEVEVDRLAQMVDELGELSLIETGRASLERGRLSVALLAHRAAERLQTQASRAGLTVSVDVPDGLPDVYGDERRLEQVMVNLLHNAIKFTPSGGSVCVSAREDNGAVAVSVQDTGVGIAEEDLARVFERFYKADRSRSGSGTGLGLAIVRHTVELHGGKVWVESVEGKGSTFTFTVPLAVA